MSQYGAYGYAQQGRRLQAHPRALLPGHELGSAHPARPVRVLLQATTPTSASAAPRGGRRRSSTRGRPTSRGASGGGLLVAHRGGRPSALGYRRSRSMPAARADPAARPRDQRHVGRALPRRARAPPGSAGGVTAVNRDQHRPLRAGRGRGRDAVLLAARGAQGAGRGGAHLRARHAQDAGAFDLYPDTRSQVYRGVAGESVRTNAAVKAHRRTDRDLQRRARVTYYFSTSGGQTENVENSFIGALSQALAEGRGGPLRRHLAAPPLAASRRPPLGSTPGSGRRVGSGASRCCSAGVSPRIVRARVYRHARLAARSPGRTSAPRLGLYDTWAFKNVRVRSFEARQRSARPASWGRCGRAARDGGRFVPRPSAAGCVEANRRPDWRTSARRRTTRSRPLPRHGRRPGVYRVRAGTVAGPAVRLR